VEFFPGGLECGKFPQYSAKPGIAFYKKEMMRTTAVFYYI